MSKRYKKKRTANQGRRIAVLAIIGGLVLLLIAGGIAMYSGNRPPAPSTPIVSQSFDAPNEQDIPYPDVLRISLTEAKEKYDAGTAIFVDVRSLEEYQARHIPNAISLPAEELAARHSELPREAEIITYCT